jgi:membrane protein required for colicin V production
MIFDIIILGVVLVSALHAFWRGFIREILTIFGAIGGVFATLAYGDDLRPLMDGWLGVVDGKDAEKLFGMVSMSIVSIGLAYLAIFVLVFGVLSFIAHLIAEQVRALGLGAVDRTLGVVFGLARGLLIVGIFYLPLHIMKVDESKKEWFQDSHTHFIVRAQRLDADVQTNRSSEKRFV